MGATNMAEIHNHVLSFVFFSHFLQAVYDTKLNSNNSEIFIAIIVL